MSHNFPYRGLRVLDLGQGVASPYCAMLLALYGAEVVKVEPPEGDWSRGLGPRHGGQTALSLTYNRGKRALCLDLKTVAGRAALRRLAERADILVEGFRPGVAARLGVGYASLAEANPRVIYVSVSGYGQDGPYAARPCTDSAAQAFSGFVSINRGPDGVPHRAAALLCDVATGLYAYQATATALYARRDTGTGRHIDISLMQGGAALLGHKLPEYLLAGGPPMAMNVPSGSYATTDGWIILALVNEAHYQRLVTVLGLPHLAADPRFTGFPARAAHEAELVPPIAAVLAGGSSAAWLDRLRAADIICDPVQDFSDWMSDPQVLHAVAATAIDQPGAGLVHVPRTPGASPAAEAALSPSPECGQHSREVLLEAGFGAAEVARLAGQGVLGAAQPLSS
jgi:crotonobetainyl-CoA:carnitine CoA-transferase CaiB-like acyl-CoA transferase